MKFLVLFFGIFFYATGFASDQIVVISGGDNPGLNNYSQYLQTKTLYDYLQQKNKDNLTLYFGAGNTDKTVNPLFDVHKTEDINHLKTDMMLPGRISNNIPATKEKVSHYFFDTKAQSLTGQGNLFVFVSDHGLPDEFLNDKQADPFSNNCIDLWHYNGTLINNFLDKDNFYSICLSKNELTTLLNVVQPKHVVFEMSQCYSGGFHQMSVSTQNGYPTANGKICGFTSAPPDHYASGCTTDANGPTYQGYERSFTEWFTGVSIPTGKQIRPAAQSIFSAHQNALLEDLTVDIPLATSDYYLWQWANLIEDSNFISRVPNFSAEKVRDIYKNYQNHLSNMTNDDFKQFQKIVALDRDQIKKKYPNESSYFNLPLDQQKKYLDHLEKLIAEQGQTFQQQMDGMMNLYRNIIYPTWQQAVKNKQVPLTKKQYQMENDFYLPIMTNHLFNFPYQFNALYAQYLSMQKNDKDVVDYHQHRDDIMKKWATSKNLPGIYHAIDIFSAYMKNFQQISDAIADKEKEKQLLKRIYIYNKIIAAWVTLQTINDTQALKDLANLLECEHSKLQ